MDAVFEFAPYGTSFDPQPDTVVLDVGMKTVPGVVDHHHADAEPECTASLLIKYPDLVLDHIRFDASQEPAPPPRQLKIITHRLPDFDAIASTFLALRLAETRRLDPAMEKLAAYTRMVDSASLPKELELTATPYSILRALFSGARKEETDINRDRMAEGLKFMRFLHSKSEEGYEIVENRMLFSGIDRYERAMRKAENDYFHYLDDLARSQKLVLELPLSNQSRNKRVDGLIVRNPSSFLLKEWARRDLTQSSLGEGFSLVVTNFGEKRYILGVDPEKGVNLRGLGRMLNEKESRLREAAGRTRGLSWYEGNCPFFDFRIIDSPQDGTLLSHQDLVETLLAYSRALGSAQVI